MAVSSAGVWEDNDISNTEFVNVELLGVAGIMWPILQSKMRRVKKRAWFRLKFMQINDRMGGIWAKCILRGETTG